MGRRADEGLNLNAAQEAEGAIAAVRQIGQAVAGQASFT